MTYGQLVRGLMWFCLVVNVGYMIYNALTGDTAGLLVALAIAMLAAICLRPGSTFQRLE